MKMRRKVSEKDFVGTDRVLAFASNRVWRCYTGGRLLEEFAGAANPKDGHFPEDWLASTTRAMNGENSQGQDEGLSRIRLDDGRPGPFLKDLIASDPEGFLGRGSHSGSSDIGVLCKFLDSSVRLPVQCHPDREFAKKYYKSVHGKTESWIILGGRTINGVPPYLLMGFKSGVEKSEFRRAVEEQDIPAMEKMLHRVEVSRGDVWFIPGRLPHAIGAGVFMLEVQEPSDWVIQPERHCAGTRLSDTDMWGPLQPDTALECFDYSGVTLPELRRRLLLRPHTIRENKGGHLDLIIGPDTTDCFTVHKLTVGKNFSFTGWNQAAIGIVTSGEGELVTAVERRRIHQGEVVLLPAGLGAFEYFTAGGLEMYMVYAGKISAP